jgi:hypothetical protein
MGLGVGRFVVGGLVALAMAACSPSGPVEGDAAKSREWVKAELLKVESQGALGDVFEALRLKEPQIYAKVIDAATRAAAEGRPLFEAGAEVRPLYLARFLELGKTAADEEVNELVAFSGEQMEAVMAIDPQICVKLGNGEADRRLTQLPKSMIDREMALMARVLNKGEQGAPAATVEETDAWIEKFATEYPDAIEGLVAMSNPAPTHEEATKICQANSTLSKALLKEDPATSARLFRAIMQQG